MTGSTQGDQVVVLIFARTATELFVMNLQLAQAAACLAFPTISPENLGSPFSVRFGFESHWASLLAKILHDAAIWET
jgi:hypothetical protein